MKDDVPILAMLVGKDGRHVGNLGVLRFPHVPQIGSIVLAYPYWSTDGETPKRDKADVEPEIHLYKIVGVTYQFNPVDDEVKSATLSDWEIDLSHVEPYSERYEPKSFDVT